MLLDALVETLVLRDQDGKRTPVACAAYASQDVVGPRAAEAETTEWGFDGHDGTWLSVPTAEAVAWNLIAWGLLAVGWDLDGGEAPALAEALREGAESWPEHRCPVCGAVAEELLPRPENAAEYYCRTCQELWHVFNDSRVLFRRG